MKFRPASLSAFCVLWAGFALACQTVDSQPAPPDYIVVEGNGSVDPAEVADRVPWALAFAGPIQASASASVPQPEPATADEPPAPAGRQVTLAMAEARRAALRDLALRIAALPDASQTPVAKSIEQKPELSAALSQLIETQAEVAMRRENAQTVVADAKVPGSEVFDLLKKFDVPFGFRLSDLPPSQQNAIKIESYNKAIEDARVRLKQQIMTLKDEDGNLLAESFAENPDRLREVDGILFMIQADETQYREDGSCRVEILFDANRARELAQPEAPGWAFWRR